MNSIPTQSMSEPAIVIAGVGLIGGSIAAALRARGFDGRVIGLGRNQARLDAAVDAGLLDEATTSVNDAAAEARLVVFCTPVAQVVDGVREFAAHSRPGTLITDVGSVKAAICAALEHVSAERTECEFVGSHPIAGSERAGFEHADAELFQNRTCVITPGTATPQDCVDRLRTFWKFLGAIVFEMSPEQHDSSLALTSHLPHLVASLLAAMLSEEHIHLTGSGFRDDASVRSLGSLLLLCLLLDSPVNRS